MCNCTARPVSTLEDIAETVDLQCIPVLYSIFVLASCTALVHSILRCWDEHSDDPRSRVVLCNRILPHYSSYDKELERRNAIASTTLYKAIARFILNVIQTNAEMAALTVMGSARLSPNHTGLTTRLRPTCDRKVWNRGQIVERTYDWSHRSWVIARAKSVAARSMVIFKTYNPRFKIISGRRYV